ncbi:MAG: hypothetical protein PVJ65_01480 [Chromatiales bacterium]|jgi:hypothetical protein
MCPVDTEFSTFSIRRTLYFKRREEGSPKHAVHNAHTGEEQQPSPIRCQELTRAETILANHQDLP